MITQLWAITSLGCLGLRETCLKVPTPHALALARSSLVSSTAAG